jgi:hypothetical protein
MGTGKRRINSADRVLAARAVGSRALAPAPEHDQVVAEPGLVPVAAEPEHGQAEVALELSPVAAEPEHGPVEVALELSPVAAEPEHDPVAAELGLVPVEAVPVPNQVAVAPRTKSVTAARRRDLARLLAGEEDLAAAVETTREPAATEAGVAWAAAVTAVAVAPEWAAVVAEDAGAAGWVAAEEDAAAAADVAAAGVVAVEDAEDKAIVDEEKTNEIKNKYYDFL